MMAHLLPDHPSESSPLYNGKDMVGNQIGIRERWQVFYHECLPDNIGESFPNRMYAQHLSAFPAAQPHPPLASGKARVLPRADV